MGSARGTLRRAARPSTRGAPRVARPPANCCAMCETAARWGAPSAATNTHWLAAGQLASSQRPSGDQATDLTPGPVSTLRSAGGDEPSRATCTPPAAPSRTIAQRPTVGRQRSIGHGLVGGDLDRRDRAARRGEHPHGRASEHQQAAPVRRPAELACPVNRPAPDQPTAVGVADHQASALHVGELVGVVRTPGGCHRRDPPCEQMVTDAVPCDHSQLAARPVGDSEAGGRIPARVRHGAPRQRPLRHSSRLMAASSSGPATAM